MAAFAYTVNDVSNLVNYRDRGGNSRSGCAIGIYGYARAWEDRMGIGRESGRRQGHREIFRRCLRDGFPAVDLG